MSEKLPSFEKENYSPLTYDEFISQPENKQFPEGKEPPMYNNFYLLFIDIENNPHRQDFKNDLLEKLHQENPTLESALTKVLTYAFREDKYTPGTLNRIVKQLEPQLYEAYKIMSQYVENDDRLFS
ncbi:MAG: hypothetical protein PHS07_03120 [Patescibacteria group bacterium]|jgi:hypothetical protein|nr:hypothetical protein [Patescibacteria group bacterium]